MWSVDEQIPTNRITDTGTVGPGRDVLVLELAYTSPALRPVTTSANHHLGRCKPTFKLSRHQRRGLVPCLWCLSPSPLAEPYRVVYLHFWDRKCDAFNLKAIKLPLLGSSSFISLSFQNAGFNAHCCRVDFRSLSRLWRRGAQLLRSAGRCRSHEECTSDAS